MRYTKFMTAKEIGSLREREGTPPARPGAPRRGSVYPPRFLEIARRLGVTPAAPRRPALPRGAADDGGDGRFLHCDPSNVTGIVDGLEDQGSGRAPALAAGDRRVKLVDLTAEGRRLRARVDREMQSRPSG